MGIMSESHVARKKFLPINHPTLPPVFIGENGEKNIVFIVCGLLWNLFSKQFLPSFFCLKEEEGWRSGVIQGDEKTSNKKKSDDDSPRFSFGCHWNGTSSCFSHLGNVFLGEKIIFQLEEDGFYSRRLLMLQKSGDHHLVWKQKPCE